MNKDNLPVYSLIILSTYPLHVDNLVCKVFRDKTYRVESKYMSIIHLLFAVKPENLLIKFLSDSFVIFLKSTSKDIIFHSFDLSFKNVVFLIY